MEREIKLWSGTKMYESDLKAIFTLDNIFKYASEDELRAIVSSIIGRLNKNKDVYLHGWYNTKTIDKHNFRRYLINCPMGILDADLDKFVKELRDVK